MAERINKDAPKSVRRAGVEFMLAKLDDVRRAYDVVPGYEMTLTTGTTMDVALSKDAGLAVVELLEARARAELKELG